MNIYNIIRRPIITEKTSELVNDLKKITFEVDMHANKPLVAEALEKLFGVSVKNVRIINRRGKNRIFKRIKSQDKSVKRAIVTLKDDQSFDKLVQLVSGNFTVNNNVSYADEKASE